MAAAPQIYPDLPPEWTGPNLRPVPDPPPVPPEPIPPAEPFPIPEVPPALPILFGILVFLWPSPTAEGFYDERNPITGEFFHSAEEYRAFCKIPPEEVKRLAAEAELKRAAAAQKKAADQAKTDPLKCAQGCAAPVTQPTVTPLTEGVIELKCDPTWDDCQKRQARAKIKRMNELAKANKGLKRRPTTGRTRDLGNTWADKFRSDFNRIAGGKKPSKFGFTNPDASGPSGSPDDFMDPCLHEQWVKNGKKDSNSSPLNKASPDHVQDLQWGGHVQGPLVWLDRDVNEKLGRDMSAGDNADIDVATEFKLECP